MNTRTCIYVVDDDVAVRQALELIIENAGFYCRSFGSAEDFLESYSPEMQGCLLLDVNLPGLSGHELQAEINRRKIHVPIIFLSAYGDIPMTVRAIKAGAVDFLTKPVPSKLLVERIKSVLEQISIEPENPCVETDFHNRIRQLTFREKEVLPLAIAGLPNKDIAQRLGISYRTVETHRIRILKKTGASNFLELARLCEGHNILPKKKPDPS